MTTGGPAAGKAATGLEAASRFPTRNAAIVSAAVVVLDQITKQLVRAGIALHDSIEVIPGVLNLVHVRNTGAAFGFLNLADLPYKRVLMTGMALLALGAIGWYAAQAPPRARLARAGLVLILGGAVGNLIDRAAVGYVVDFVDVYWGSVHFWAFNVADSAITVGACLLLLDAVRSPDDVSTPV